MSRIADHMANHMDKPVAAETGDFSADGRKYCVLQVLPSLELGGGGVERGAIDIAAALQAAGHRAIIASSGGGQVPEILRAGAEHIELKMASKNPLTMRANSRRLAKIIAREGVDIIHARSRAPAWSAMAAARRTGIPYLTTFHGTYNFSGRLKHKYNSVMARGDLVIANSHFIGAHIRANYDLDPARIRVIARGIDLAQFDPAKLRAERVLDIAEHWQIDNGVPTIMLAGRLTRWKGQEVLIDALAQLGVRPLTCLLVGGDQGRTRYRKELETKIEACGLNEVVRIVGHTGDMPAALMLADVVVSASTDPEAFGRVVAEAQAMGRPVVVANHGGAAEQVVDGKTGWVFEPGNADDLAAKLTQALGLDTTAREIMAAKAIAHVRGKYGKERMCAATLAVYDELMST